MNETQKNQIIHWLNAFIKTSNNFDEDGNKPLSEYWKGQVMGICKMITLLELDIDGSYYLNQLP